MVCCCWLLIRSHISLGIIYECTYVVVSECLLVCVCFIHTTDRLIYMSRHRIGALFFMCLAVWLWFCYRSARPFRQLPPRTQRVRLGVARCSPIVCIYCTCFSHIYIYVLSRAANLTYDVLSVYAPYNTNTHLDRNSPYHIIP